MRTTIKRVGQSVLLYNLLCEVNARNLTHFLAYVMDYCIGLIDNFEKAYKSSLINSNNNLIFQSFIFKNCI